MHIILKLNSAVLSEDEEGGSLGRGGTQLPLGPTPA